MDWIKSPNAVLVFRYLTACSMTLAIVFALLFLQGIVKEQWTWVVRRHPVDNLAAHLPQIATVYLPVPIAYMMWLRLMERDEKFVFSYSAIFAAITVVVLVVAQEFPNVHIRRYAIGISVFASLFVLVPWREFIQRVMRHPRAAIVAVIAGLAACNYYWLMRTMWDYMCEWTLHAVYALMQLLQLDATMQILGRVQESFLINSPHFTARINPGCNGLEGIFLFNFMLSLTLLLDWELFKKRSLILLYGFGFIYMFFMNVLRIVAFFSLGYWANNPEAWGWVQELKGAPVQLFHSYIGWLFYLIAFAVFSLWLYRPQRSS